MNWKVTALVSGLALMHPVVTFVLSESPEKKLTQLQEESPLLVGMVRFELTILCSQGIRLNQTRPHPE